MADSNVGQGYELYLQSDIDVQIAHPDWPSEAVDDYQARFRNLLLLTGAFDDSNDQVLDNKEAIEALDIRVTQNELDISALDVRVTQNESDIALNAQDILFLEHRALGQARPDAYGESLGYSKGDFVVSPTDDPQNYFRANQDIAAPAGGFNPSLWTEYSIRNSVPTEYVDEYPVTRGYGGIESFGPVAIPDISLGAYQAIFFGSDSVATPKDVTQDSANNFISVDSAGVWSASIILSLTFAVDIAARPLNVRIRNATDSSTVNEFFYQVPANATEYDVSIPSKLIDFDVSLIGKELIIEIGGGGAFLGITLLTATFEVSRVSNLSGIV